MIKLIAKIKRIKEKWSWRRLWSNLRFFATVDFDKYAQQREDMIYKIKDEVLEEYCREESVIKDSLHSLNVLNGETTLDVLKKRPKSFTRYGDGEIRIMKGIDQPFQNYNPELAKKMLAILQSNRSDLYIGLNYAYFDSPMNYSDRNRRFYRLYATEFRRFFTTLCSSEREYLDAACFGAYFRYGNDFDYEAHYERIKDLFSEKDIVIVSGEGVIEKLTYSIFEKAKSTKIIHAPRINAFDEYSSILDTVKKEACTDQLICIILGMTATVMVADLTDMGYMAWDIGHVAKDYNAYMMREEKTQENMDRFWAPD